ncbi:MAG: hypothetical protein J7M38_10175, partial [Armatimonadetes bacterium]|nr:hypothetical protein [Armatimonadota bacterium]
MNRRHCTRLALSLSVLLVALIVPATTPEPLDAGDDTSQLPYMDPDEETLQKWLLAYNTAGLSTTETVMTSAAEGEPGGSLSLLPHIEYVPSERNQGSCENCWAWAGTGCMEIALDIQEDIHQRLSVQYINSCQSGTIGKPCCSGGWLTDVVDFYDAVGACIPWSNPGAEWAGEPCSVTCSSIVTEPHYDIPTIEAWRIPTHSNEGVQGDYQAISNIKAALDSGHGVWFAFFTSSQASWSSFSSFWLNESEDSICDLDALCSGSTRGPAHAVLCVGYDETGPEDYWVMLNSWGTAGGNRPNGTFRVEMDMDYDTSNVIPAFYWQTLNVE